LIYEKDFSKVAKEAKEYNYKDVIGHVYHFNDWESKEKNISVCLFDMKMVIENK